MKKQILLATLLVASIIFTSCKGDYTCKCKITEYTTYIPQGGKVTTGIPNSSEVKIEYKDIPKSDAEANCDDNNAEVGATVTVTEENGDVTKINRSGSCELE